MKRGRPKGSKIKVEKKIVKKSEVSQPPTKSDYFAKLQSITGNEYLSLVEKGEVNEVKRYIDTGSYSMNALLSGKLQGGGIPEGRIIALAGEEATGKSFFTYQIEKEFLDANPSGGVFHFESEQHPEEIKRIMKERGLDTNRVFILPVATLQEFKVQATRIVNNVLKQDPLERRPMLIAEDSMGMLSTTKEAADAESGKDVRDMTRQQIVRGIFRVLTLKCAMAGITMVLTNHTYAVIGSMYPMKEMAGGGGIKYAASEIVFLSSSKEKASSDPTDVVGANIKCVLTKGRITREFKRVETQLDHARGLRRYSGLIDFAIAAGIWTAVDKKIKLHPGSKIDKGIFKSKINNEPEKYFTKEVMDKLDAWAATEFLYGSSGNALTETERVVVKEA